MVTANEMLLASMAVMVACIALVIGLWQAREAAIAGELFSTVVWSCLMLVGLGALAVILQ